MLRNFGYENGTSGVELVPTDAPASGDNAFTARFRSTGSSIQYDSSTASAGSQSGKYSVSAGTASQTMWEALGTVGQCWIKFRVRLNAFPAATCRPLLLRSGGDATTQGFIAINSTGQILLEDQSFTARATSTALSLNTWYRVEAMFNFGSPSGELWIWNDAASAGAADQHIVATTPTFTAASIDAIQHGVSFSAAQTFSLNLDDVGISDVGPMGPGGTATPGPVGLPVQDVTVTGWSPSTGTSIFPLLGDASDSTFATSPASPVNSVIEEKIGPLSANPSSITARLDRAVGSSSGSATVSLVQGSTVIATSSAFTLTTSPADCVLTVTSTQQSAITDRDDLRVRILMTVA